MNELPLNAEPDSTDFVAEGSSEELGLIIHGANPMPPEVGMEFESYDDVYYFYSCFAKDQGFGVRVSNTWYRKSKERYRAKLSCSSAGFKKRSEANRPRPETRTGCPAMIKFRLMENGRWRVIEVELEHNHLVGHVGRKLHKSHSKLMLGGAGTKRALDLDLDVDASSNEVQKVRVYHTVVINDDDDVGNEVFDMDGGEFSSGNVGSNRLQLRAGDARAIQDFLAGLQLMDSTFFYVLDLNERGVMRNLFWADTKSRASYHDFGDVIAIDTMCLSLKFEVPLVSFVGVNHHGQSVLLGCGLLAVGGTTESYTWLLRAWLTCMSGCSPQVIITDHCQILQAVIVDVFPRASHCLYLHSVLMKVEENLRGHLYSEVIWGEFSKTVRCVLRPEEFEVKWEEMIVRNGMSDNRLIEALYEDRKRWVPAYVKETFLAGMFPIQQDDDRVSSFFEGHLDSHTSLTEFLGKYYETLQNHRQLETLADKDCKNSSFMKSRCYFEMQLSKLYTDEVLTRFAREIEGMYSCFSTRQVKADGPIITYIVHEQVDGIRSSQTMSFEVVFNAAERDVLCVCGLFNLKGYLCRHAMSVLSQNGVEEIPPQYVVSRWRKDIRRGRVLDHDCSAVDTDKQIHRYEHLYRHIMAAVNEGRRSQNHHKVTIQGLESILHKLHLSTEPGL